MGSRPRLSLYARQCIRHLTNDGTSAAKIVETLWQEGISTCQQTVWQIQQHFEEHGTVKPLHKSGRPTKLRTTVLQSIENSMQRDDETTDKELVTTLRENGVFVSTTTTLKGRRGVDKMRNSLLPGYSCGQPQQATRMGPQKCWSILRKCDMV